MYDNIDRGCVVCSINISKTDVQDLCIQPTGKRQRIYQHPRLKVRRFLQRRHDHDSDQRPTQTTTQSTTDEQPRTRLPDLEIGFGTARNGSIEHA